MNFWDGKELFKELPFYNTFIEKPRIKHLKNIDLLHELLFSDELSQFTVIHTNTFSFQNFIYICWHYFLQKIMLL